MTRLPNRAGGGARTNFNGLNFERETSLAQAFRNKGFTVTANHEVYYGDQYIGLSINKAAFSTVFLRERGINYLDYNSKRWDPDEAFINDLNNTIYIIEKKFQGQAGSVDEKLATFPFKIQEYQRLIEPIDYKVEYIYLLSSYFNQPRYDDYFDYMQQDGCPYFFNELPFYAIGLDF